MGKAIISNSRGFRLRKGERSKDTGRLVLLDENGKELEMQRGKSFFIVTNDVTEVICTP